MPWNNYLLLFIIASTKFALTPIISLQMDIGKKELFIIMLIGGLIGHFSFFYFSDFLISKFSDLKMIRRKKTKRVFTKRNRMIIKLVRKRGLILLALITPIILSIPVGAFLAARYFTNKSKINIVMVTAIVFWAIIYTTFRSLIITLL